MLRIENGIMVNIPNTLGVENVIQVLSNRCKKGNSHIVAFTNVDTTKKAKNENMSIIKITDVNCVLGKPKYNKTTNTTETTTTRKPSFERIEINGIKNLFIKYIKSQEIAISTQVNKAKQFKGKSYYIDQNTGRVYDKHYLMENGYIYKQKDREQVEGEPIPVTFKLNNIIYIK